MKKILGLLLISVMLFAMVGCQSKEAEAPASDDTKTEAPAEAEAPAGDDKIVIAGIYKAGDQVWFIDEGKAAEAKAKELGADEFIYIDAKMNPDTYLQAIDNVIAQKVDGVITCTPDQTLSAVVVKKLGDAGIPVIAADDALQDEDGNKTAPWVGISAYEIGLEIGKWMGNYAVENDMTTGEDVGVLLLTVDTVSSCVPRIEGEIEAFMEVVPDFDENQVFRADSDGSTEDAFAAASGVITGNPQVTKWIVMGVNDEGGVGAVRALEQAGIDKESVVAGLGGYLAVGEFEKEYSAMKCAAYFSASQVGGTSAENLMNYILHGTEMPMEQAVTAIMVTEENYKDVMDEYK